MVADNRHVDSTQTTVWRIADRVTHVIASRFSDFIRMPDPEVIILCTLRCFTRTISLSFGTVRAGYIKVKVMNERSVSLFNI